MDRHRRILWILGLAIGGWAVLLFFENSYFAANFYGVTVPSWATWVGQLSVTEINLIDTLFFAILIVSLVLGWYWGHRKRKLRNSGRGSVASTVLLLVLVIAVLIVLGFTLTSFWSGVRHFFGV
jgi:hypothetical protein